MNDQSQPRPSRPGLYTTRFLAGAVGGYVWGFLGGIWDGAGFHNSAAVAGHTCLTGGLAWLVGYMLYKWTRGLGRTGMALAFGVGAGMFTCTTALIVEPSIAGTMIYSKHPVGALVSGFVGGAVGGTLCYSLLRRQIERQKNA